MTDAALPSCHDYPPDTTKFETVKQFGEFRKFFCHMRNANFQTYNNSASALYICPNYKNCKGVLHGFRHKDLAEDDCGNPIYDRNGYLKYEKLPQFTIGPLTNACNCFPERYTTIEATQRALEMMLGTRNVSRTEFTNLANSYIAMAGKSNYQFRDTAYQLSWKCLLCKSGHLQLTMNRNETQTPSRYKSYGTITRASPCNDSCPSRGGRIGPKMVWLPKSHAPSEMAVTAEQIEAKKQKHNSWVREVKQIAQNILTTHQISKKPWKLNHKSEQQFRNRIENRKAKIALSSRNRTKSTKPTEAHPSTNGSTLPIDGQQTFCTVAVNVVATELRPNKRTKVE